MNIFVLDHNIQKCAQAHCDKHVVKMILESAQLLSSVHQFHNKPAGYKMSAGHMKHPCAIWARESWDNYWWLFELAIELGDEYTYRYGKVHKSIEVIESLPVPDTAWFPKEGMTQFAKAFGDYGHLKSIEDPVEAYREYYRRAKRDIATYNKGREAPEWF